MQKNEHTENVSSTPVPPQVTWPPSLFRLVLAALVSAGLSFLVLKAIYPVFVLPEDIAYVPEQAPIEVYQKHDEAQYEADGKNFAVVFGLSGAILGFCSVAFAFGIKQTKAIGVGVVASSVLGVIGAFLSNWMFNYMRTSSDQSVSLFGISLNGMAQSMVGYFLLWGLIGLGVGLGVGAVRAPSKSFVAGFSGLLGGAFAAMAYVLLASQISISTVMNRVLPDGNMTQALWLVFFPVVTVACIALGSGEKKQKNAT